MKKIIMGICIFLTMILLVLGGIYCIKYFFWEPSVPYSSKYDEQYVASSKEGVYLQSQDILQLQKEVLEFARQYKSIDSLCSMTVVLNRDYETIGFDMDFNLEDVDGYHGIMHVRCTRETSQWMIYMADSYYNVKEGFGNIKYLDLYDDLLVAKTDAVIQFIQQNVTEQTETHIFEFYLNKVLVWGVNAEGHRTYDLRLFIDDEGNVEVKSQ